jgi:hypothetical protein
MRTQLRTGAIALVLLGGGFAVAQTPSGAQQEKLNLSQAKERMVTQGLASEPTQSPSGYQGQMGSKPPDSMQARALPSSVTDQVPETKNLLFIKMPDRIVLIDPDSKLVAEIVPIGTTGSGSDSMAPSSSPPAGSPSR